MKTASLECQIAREQLKRYLGGTKLSPELVRGLERHLASCPDCLALARQKRQPEAQKQPASSAKDSAKVKKGPAFAVVDAAKAAAGKPLDDKKKAATRSIVLGSMLVLTLGAMALISRNPEGLLGRRVITAEAAAPKTESTPPAATIQEVPEPLKGDPMPMVSSAQDIVSAAPEPEVELPEASTTSAPKPIVRIAAQRKKASNPSPPKRQTTRPSAPRNNAPAKSDTGSIRVYDASGRPINP